MFGNIFKKLFTRKEKTALPQEPEQKKSKFGDETLENIQFSFDDIKVYNLQIEEKPDLMTMAILASKQQTPECQHKPKKQRDFQEIIEKIAFKSSADERKQCIAVFEKSNKFPVAYYKISPYATISMTEFKRKARRHYTDNKKCEYINTRAISLDTYIARLK